MSGSGAAAAAGGDVVMAASIPEKGCTVCNLCAVFRPREEASPECRCGHRELEHAPCSLTQEQFPTMPFLVLHGRCSDCGLGVGRHASRPAERSRDDVTEALRRLELGQHRLTSMLPKCTIVTDFTPSAVSHSGKDNPARQAFDQLIDALGLTFPREDTDLYAVDMPTVELLSFQWPARDRVEKAAYEPVCEWIRGAFPSLQPVVIADGQHLSNKLLFDQPIFSLRKVLSDHGGACGDVMYRGRIYGRSDLAVLAEHDDLHIYPEITRHRVLFLVEVKVPMTQVHSHGGGGDKEAVAQLLAMNANNHHRRCPVLLTDLVRVFRVFWVKLVGADPLQFSLRRQSPPTLAAAVALCMQLSVRSSDMVHFCRSRTPPVSVQVSPEGSREPSPDSQVDVAEEEVAEGATEA